jgi:hypothetical protein
LPFLIGIDKQVRSECFPVIEQLCHLKSRY